MVSDTRTPAPRPILHGRRPPGPVSMAVLVLHGGKVASYSPAERSQLSSLRMVPFVRALERALGPTAAITMLQYRYRGWNGDDRSPVADARWALDEIRRRHGDVPVVLVGHSMGGRTAAAVADDRSVTAVKALAPWWPDGDETATMRPGQALSTMHGLWDRWTDPRLARRATEAARARGIDAVFIGVRWAGHFMLAAPWRWTRQVRRFVVDQSPEARATKHS